jgi:predicted ATPase/class 3 adenylate cyclase
VRRGLPSGTVTFLFTDVEGSTKLLHELGAEGYADALAEHRRILREAFAWHGGVEVDTQGDAFFVAFPSAPGALAAAAQALDRLKRGPIRVRMGIHTGTPHVAAEGYVGVDVHRAARIAAAGHGGQLLVSAATAALLRADGLRDLGEHRLKDFDQPVAIYQIGDESFPPLRTISNTNLPRPVSSFVGRERDVEEVASLLRDGARLLTLTGPGGSGKTRLALEAAAELVPQFKAGVFWVGLAALRDPALVTETIAHALGANDGLAEHIGERELLLLLDNLEQVVAASPELASLVEDCPNLRLLVTSRELLRVRGEVEYPVPPLAEREGVALFCDRARAEPDESVEALCRALDNLPLALELAAARASVLSPRQILERLSQRLDLLKGGRDADPRQQTLRATIAWSYELLAADEQQLFARLSVFRGGCTLEGAEAVCEADLDTFQSLVDKSLLRQREERFWMLETIREYALERLEQSTEDVATRGRHLEFFVRLAERAYEERFTSAETWFHVMDDELDDLRAALDWARRWSHVMEAQLAGAVAYYWSLRGNVREARERLACAVQTYTERDRLRARALTGLATSMGMDRDAFPVLEDALSICREQTDTLGEAAALEAIAYKHIAFGEEDAARRAFEQSLALRERVGADEVEGWHAVGGLCQLLTAAGEVTRAEPMARELFQLGERHGNLDAQGDALHYLADCALIAGDFVEAERRYLRALVHARTCGIAGQAVEELRGVAMSAAGQGDHRRAARLAALASAQREALGIRPLSSDHWWSRLQDRFIGGGRAQLPPDDVANCERAGREADFDSVVEELIGAAA